MYRPLIAFLAVPGLILSFSPGIRLQANKGVSFRQNSARVVADRVAAEHSTWSDYAGAPDGAQYSALDQINRLRVSQLQVAWSYPTGDGNKYLFNPLVVDRTMYVLARNNSIVALDAVTGRELGFIRPGERLSSSRTAASIIGKVQITRRVACCSLSTTPCRRSMPAPDSRSRISV